MSAAKTKTVTKLYLGAPPEKPVRLSFPNLFIPVAIEDGKDRKYSAVFLLPLNYDMTPLKAAVVAAVTAKWGALGIELLKAGEIKLPWRNQAEKPNLEGYSEGWFITCSSKNKPGVVNAAVQPVIDPAEVAAGMQVIATVNPYAWDHPMTGKGVGFGLLNVMIAADDGTRYGGAASKPEEDFAQFAKSAPAAGPAVSDVDNLFG